VNLKRILWRIGDYVRYRMCAVNEHGVHSPFVFQLLKDVLRTHPDSKRALIAQKMRAAALKNQTLIPMVDFGAGSTLGREKRNKTVSRICTQSAITCHKGNLLFRLARHFQPEIIIELGTNLGLGTACLAEACPGSVILSIEGNPHLARWASENLSASFPKCVEVICGQFDDELPRLLNRSSRCDLVYIDGNHTFEATTRYFEILLPFVHSDSVLVFDDIHWSAEMKKAWDTIVSHQAAVLTVDFYCFGLVFFRQGVPKQHFVLK